MGKQPESSSHTGKPSSRPSTEASVDAIKAKIVIDPEVKALMEREKIGIESDAMKGLLTEHAAFEASLGLRKEPNHKTSAVFETNLAKRLGGEEAFEKKELKLEDIKDLQALTCKNGKDGQGGCGHSKFNLSCRRISGFLAATSAATLSVPIGKAFYDFLKAEPSKDGKTIEVSGVTENGGALVIKDLDKPAPGEDITPARESK
jgi:Holliday junction resolvase